MIIAGHIQTTSTAFVCALAPELPPNTFVSSVGLLPMAQKKASERLVDVSQFRIAEFNFPTSRGMRPLAFPTRPGPQSIAEGDLRNGRQTQLPHHLGR